MYVYGDTSLANTISDNDKWKGTRYEASDDREDAGRVKGEGERWKGDQGLRLRLKADVVQIAESNSNGRQKKRKRKRT